MTITGPRRRSPSGAEADLPTTKWEEEIARGRFHATDIPNVPARNLVQIGIGGWQAPRPGVKVGRERGPRS
jgi:hypothetical protein